MLYKQNKMHQLVAKLEVINKQKASRNMLVRIKK